MKKTNPITKQLEEGYFKTIKWCLKNQDLLNKSNYDPIWDRLWEKEFFPIIKKAISQSNLDLLNTIESEAEELEKYWTNNGLDKNDISLSRIAGQQDVLQLLRNKLKKG